MSSAPLSGARVFGVLAVLVLMPALLAACGGDESSDAGPVASQPAPSASAFPEPPKSLQEVVAAGEQTNETVILPGAQTIEPGEDRRVSFGVFDVGNEQLTDLDVAIYAQRTGGGEVLGPFPAAIESLETPAAFVAQTTSGDPDAAKVLYVTRMDLPAKGNYDLAAVIDTGDGEQTTFVPSIRVGAKAYERIPDVGQKAPSTHTDTLDDVGNVAEIDTRVPAGTMHDTDLADAIGKEPVVLLFATPALCQTQVCGPVVDIAEQVKSERPDDAAYIHQEIYVDNNPGKGARPPVKDFGLRTEPWLFVLDAEGRIVERIEGAFSKDELDAALDEAQRSS